MNETDKLIEEQFKKLPLNLQWAINAVPWKALVQEIGRVNALDTKQIISLEQETMFIIYTFEPPEDYIRNLMREIGISEEVAYIIAESVADKIFTPISEKAKGYQSNTAPVVVPEIAPTILPMVEEGEVAHTVDSKQYTVDSKPEPVKVSLPDYRYPGGKDPYREPLK